MRFAVDVDVVDFSHCHCSQCRRLHGAAYATFAGVNRGEFRYIQGADDVSTYSSSPSNVRVFCSICGSTILCDPQDEPEYLYLSMSTLDGDPVLPSGYHAWVDSKAPWHEIADELPQYDTDSPADAGE